MKKIGVFPGSFDPFTKGHSSLVNKALSLFDEVIIAIGVNNVKARIISNEHTQLLIEKLYANNPKVKVISYSGLTIDFCKQMKAQFLIRGLRGAVDFEYERTIADVNLKLNAELETVFFLTPPEESSISSTIVRDLLRNNADISAFVETEIVEDLKEYYKNTHTQL